MKHILVVDDEQLIRYSLTAALQSRETEVIAQPDAASGLKALGDWPFDFCFLDIQLPDANGVDVLKMIRQLAPKTKVIMMTGSLVDDAAKRIIRQNAFLLLPKPFDLFRLKRLVEAVTRDDANEFQELNALEERLAIDRRRTLRQNEAKHVTYVMAGGAHPEERSHQADLLDISDSGTRIRTECRLEPGNLIRFTSSMNEAAGIVRWTATDERTDRCLAGIQFIGREKR